MAKEEKRKKRQPRVEMRHPVTGETVLVSPATAERLRAEAVVPESVEVEGETPLAEMTKAELVSYAEEHDLDVDVTAKKAELLAEIENVDE